MRRRTLAAAGIALLLASCAWHERELRIARRDCGCLPPGANLHYAGPVLDRVAFADGRVISVTALRAARGIVAATTDSGAER